MMERRNDPTHDHILGLTRKERPRVLFVGTATGDDAAYIVSFYATYDSDRCAPHHLPLFHRSIDDGDDEESRVAIRSATNASFRFDQIAALYELIAQARTASVSPLDGIRRLWCPRRRGGCSTGCCPGGALATEPRSRLSPAADRSATRAAAARAARSATVNAATGRLPRKFSIRCC